MSRLQNPPVLCFGHGFFTLLSKQIVSEFYCIRPLAASQEAEYQILTALQILQPAFFRFDVAEMNVVRSKQGHNLAEIFPLSLTCLSTSKALTSKQELVLGRLRQLTLYILLEGLISFGIACPVITYLHASGVYFLKVGRINMLISVLFRMFYLLHVTCVV